MPNTPKGNSLLAVDIGAVNTRAAYFDLIEGGFRCIGLGQSPTTSNAPVHNTMIGVQLAIENLQAIIGKSLMDDDGHLIIPSQTDGLGVDGMVTTFSLGPAIRTLIVGMLPEVSLKSVEKLVQTTYARVVDSFTLTDSRSASEQVDAIVRCSPELILIAGGVDGGSTKFIQKMLETIGLGVYLLPETDRPVVLFAGNNQLAQDVQVSLTNIASHVLISPNIRPTLDVEDLALAQSQVADIVTGIRQKQMPELDEVRTLSNGILLPSSFAQGRMVRFLSRYFGSTSGVLSVDIGASALSFAASFGGDLHLNVFPQLGLGSALADLLKQTTLDEIIRWLPVEISPEIVRTYLFQKSVYPGAIPVTKEELAIEQAIVRQNLTIATRWMLQRLPARFRLASGLLPSFEPILVGGAAITGVTKLAEKLLILLDGLQPAGITTLALDHNNMLAMLGAASQVNSLLPVQAIDAGALSYLASVISPVSNANYGTPIVRAKLIRDDGTEMTSEIQMGNLQVLPLESHHTARLQLRPLKRADVGLGPGKAGEVDVNGSAIGVVIDARGRPLRLPTDSAKRQSLMQNWLATLGG
jgi:MutL protein